MYCSTIIILDKRTNVGIPKKMKEEEDSFWHSLVANCKVQMPHLEVKKKIKTKIKKQNG